MELGSIWSYYRPDGIFQLHYLLLEGYPLENLPIAWLDLVCVWRTKCCIHRTARQLFRCLENGNPQMKANNKPNFCTAWSSNLASPKLSDVLSCAYMSHVAPLLAFFRNEKSGKATDLDSTGSISFVPSHKFHHTSSESKCVQKLECRHLVGLRSVFWCEVVL